MIVFAKTRYQYDSYQDFWRLVELSGFPTCYLDEIELSSENVYIFTPHNGEFPALVAGWGLRYPNRRCKIIWWLLERPDGGPKPLAESVNEVASLFDGMLASDRWVAGLHPGFTHAVLGGHAGLVCGQEPLPIVYDYAHISYAWGRREALYNGMKSLGLRVAPNAFGAERARILAQTRLVVNAQQYPAGVIAPFRFAIAAASRLPVISEEVHDSYPHDSSDLVQAPYAQLAMATKQLLGEPNRMAELAGRLYLRLCVEWTFRRGVEEAVSRCLP